MERRRQVVHDMGTVFKLNKDEAPVFCISSAGSDDGQSPQAPLWRGTAAPFMGPQSWEAVSAMAELSSN
jgi:hypothetical protein